MADATGITPHQHRYSAYSRRGSAGDLQPSSTHPDTIRCHLSSRADRCGGSFTTTYSADGMRQKKVNSSGTVIFVRDGQNVLIETDANLITQAHYTDSPGEWDGLASERRGSTSNFYGFDQQSNSRILVSIGGNITDGYLYKAFGEELLVSGTTVNPLRFGGEVGYYRDIASRLYVRARHLRTDLGRWMSRDPIGFKGGWHLYQYVVNAPVLFTDPTGLQWWRWPCCNPAIKLCCQKPKLSPIEAAIWSCIKPEISIGPSLPIPNSGNTNECIYNFCVQFTKLTLLSWCNSDLNGLFERFGVELPPGVHIGIGICDCIADAICKAQTSVHSMFDICKGASDINGCMNCCDNIANAAGISPGFCYRLIGSQKPI